MLTAHICVCVRVFSCVQLFVTPGTIALQAPLFVEFFRQEYWSGLTFFISGDHYNPGIEQISCISRQIPYYCSTWEAQHTFNRGFIKNYWEIKDTRKERFKNLINVNIFIYLLWSTRQRLETNNSSYYILKVCPMRVATVFTTSGFVNSSTGNARIACVVCEESKMLGN